MIRLLTVWAVVFINYMNPVGLQDELIRRKIENLPETKALNNNYEVYCIPSLSQAYLDHEFAPFWSDQEKADELIAWLGQSGKEGLNSEDYHVSDILEIRNTPSSENLANLDILLTDAFILYASHLLSGKVNPESIEAEWHLLKNEANPLKYLSLLDSVTVSEIFTAIRPSNEDYRALQAQLDFFRSIEKQPFTTIPSGTMLKPGMADPRVPLIRNLLVMYGDLTEQDTTEEDTYDDAMKAAVISFQERHGLEAIGNIGDQTIAMLNLSPAERIKTIEVNLERIRWLPRELTDYHLMVNIVNFELEVVKQKTVERNHRVIVGRDYRKTPVFSSTLDYVVFNPTWTIPPTILRNDVIPSIKRDSDYLNRNRIGVYNNRGVRLDPDTINWDRSDIYSFTYRQEPGRANALGLVKFMFPNSFSVYLHDTPARELFGRTERAFSSGCIRVDKPLELAGYLLQDQPGYSQADINRIIDSGITTTVMLNQKPQVYLIYLTTWVDDSGRIQFRKDIYNRDERLYKALREKPVYDIN